MGKGELVPDTFPLDRRWPDPHKGPWRITGLFRADANGWRCVDLHVQALEAADPEQAITGELIRRLKPGELGDVVRRAHREGLEEIAKRGIAPGLARELAGHLGAGSRKASRIRELSREHLVAVAMFYVSASLVRNDPTRAVADHWHRSISTAARWIGAARREGILSETTQGRPGGRLKEGGSKQ
jgi:hypothetical protein